LSVLVDRAAEEIVATDVGRRGNVAIVGRAAAVWGSELECSMGPVLVVVVGVDVQNSFEVAASEDEDAIEAVAADGAHPALGERVRVRRLQRRADRGCPTSCVSGSGWSVSEVDFE
jgi:uncharacterized protein (DUF1786 family)